jgi:hypothetical protein
VGIVRGESVVQEMLIGEKVACIGPSVCDVRAGDRRSPQAQGIAAARCPVSAAHVGQRAHCRGVRTAIGVLEGRPSSKLRCIVICSQCRATRRHSRS